VSTLALLTRLSSLQDELFSLAQVMLGVLEQEDMDALQDAWEKRRALFEEVNACYRELGPAFAAWDDCLAELAPQQAGQAQEIVERLSLQAREVLALDERATALMEAQMRKINASLHHLNLGRRAIRAYGPPPLGQGGPDRLSRLG
jgi:ABC-type sugar transport system ATPase subunit